MTPKLETRPGRPKSIWRGVKGRTDWEQSGDFQIRPTSCGSWALFVRRGSRWVRTVRCDGKPRRYARPSRAKIGAGLTVAALRRSAERRAGK